MTDLADRISRGAVAALDLAPFDDRFSRLSRQVLAGGASRFERVVVNDEPVQFVIPVGLPHDRIDYGALVLQNSRVGVLWRDANGVDQGQVASIDAGNPARFSALMLGGEQWIRFDLPTDGRELTFLVPPVSSPLLRTTLIQLLGARPGAPRDDLFPEPEREPAPVVMPDPEPVSVPTGPEAAGAEGSTPAAAPGREGEPEQGAVSEDGLLRPEAPAGSEDGVLQLAGSEDELLQPEESVVQAEDRDEADTVVDGPAVSDMPPLAEEHQAPEADATTQLPDLEPTPERAGSASSADARADVPGHAEAGASADPRTDVPGHAEAGASADPWADVPGHAEAGASAAGSAPGTGVREDERTPAAGDQLDPDPGATRLHHPFDDAAWSEATQNPTAEQRTVALRPDEHLDSTAPLDVTAPLGAAWPAAEDQVEADPGQLDSATGPAVPAAQGRPVPPAPVRAPHERTGPTAPLPADLYRQDARQPATTPLPSAARTPVSAAPAYQQAYVPAPAPAVARPAPSMTVRGFLIGFVGALAIGGIALAIRLLMG